MQTQTEKFTDLARPPGSGASRSGGRGSVEERSGLRHFGISPLITPHAGSRLPRLSIGLPVYNGGDLLPLAIDSVLAQTFGDFELIICDNASTDQTEELCRAYARRDPRVVYHRSERTLGAAKK